MKKLFTIILMLGICAMASAADVAGWEAFVIRNANPNPPGGDAPVISDDVSGGKLFSITQGGQKAGWGTNTVNGLTISDITAISIDRDNETSGWGPYMNIWITDGLGGYAVLSNEPSHPWEYTDNGETAYDMTWEGSLKNATCWLYEVDGTQGFKLPNDSMTYSSIPAGTSPAPTFNDFSGYTIATPSTHWGGGGAPDDLNAATYTAYGFNWVFGDTQENYLDGYLVSDPTIVPEPATMCLLGLGSLLLRKRK